VSVTVIVFFLRKKFLWRSCGTEDSQLIFFGEWKMFELPDAIALRIARCQIDKSRTNSWNVSCTFATNNVLPAHTVFGLFALFHCIIDCAKIIRLCTKSHFQPAPALPMFNRLCFCEGDTVYNLIYSLIVEVFPDALMEQWGPSSTLWLPRRMSAAELFSLCANLMPSQISFPSTWSYQTVYLDNLSKWLPVVYSY